MLYNGTWNTLLKYSCVQPDNYIIQLAGLQQHIDLFQDILCLLKEHSITETLLLTSYEATPPLKGSSSLLNKFCRLLVPSYFELLWQAPSTLGVLAVNVNSKHRRALVMRDSPFKFCQHIQDIGNKSEISWLPFFLPPFRKHTLSHTSKVTERSTVRYPNYANMCYFNTKNKPNSLS